MFFNLAMIIVALCWSLGGALRDIYNFAKSLLYDMRCEAIGFADVERQSMWEKVDEPGLINLIWYDFLVKRNRYSHSSYREEVVGLESETAVGDDEDDAYNTRQLFDRKYIMRIIKEDQESARTTFERFHEGFAAFVSRIDEDRITPEYEQRIHKQRRRLIESTNSVSSMRRKLEGLDKSDLLVEASKFDVPQSNRESFEQFLDDVRSEEHVASERDLINLMCKYEEQKQRMQSQSEDDSDDMDEQISRDLSHFKYRASLLCNLYSKSTLALLVFYLEYIIKAQVSQDVALDELGPGDIASQLIQFFRVFSEDADKSSAETDATKLSKARASKGEGKGGWGTPTGTPQKSGDGETANGWESDSDGKKSALERRYFLYRPFQQVGIDLKQFLEGNDLELRGGHKDGGADKANAVMSMAHSLATDFSLVQGLGAIGLD
eukprot:SAG31_NODE_5952_length_2244_cov_1.307226_1_plen_436_part_00